jgi:hypothetical protein
MEGRKFLFLSCPLELVLSSSIVGFYIKQSKKKLCNQISYFLVDQTHSSKKKWFSLCVCVNASWGEMNDANVMLFIKLFCCLVHLPVFHKTQTLEFSVSGHFHFFGVWHSIVYNTTLFSNKWKMVSVLSVLHYIIIHSWSGY